MNSYDLHNEPFDESPSTTRLQFSVNQITTYRSTFEQELAQFVDIGIPAIGLWKQKLDHCDQTEVVDRLRAAELAVSSVSHVGAFTCSSGMSFNEALDEAYETLYLARAVRASVVVVAPGSRGQQYTRNHERRLVCDAIAEMSMAADDLNLDLVLQPMRPEYARRWTYLHSIDDMQRLMDRVNHPRVKMVLDSFHLANEPELTERLPGLVSRIGHVQLSDCVGEPSNEYDRLMPGDGELPISQTVRILAENGYREFFDIQVWSQNIWKKDSRQLLADCKHAMHRLSQQAAPRQTVAK